MSSDRILTYFNKASTYGMLADYYKYQHPTLHMHYYKKHLNNLQKGIDAERLSNRQAENERPARIRLLHAIPDAPNVDIFLNGTRVLKDFSYRKTTDYLAVPKGKYQVDVYPAGNHVSSLISRKIDVGSGKSYTAVAAGSGKKLYLQTYEDQFDVPNGEAKMRFIHLSPDAGEVDLAVKNSDIIFHNIPFRKATNYLNITPMNVDLEVRKAGTKDVALSLPNVNFLPNNVYSIFVIGFANDEPSLEALLFVP